MSGKTQETTLVTKREALQILAKFLRKPDLDAVQLVKLITLQAKIAGWDKAKEPSGEPNLDKLVREVEQRKRREAN